MTNIEDEIKAKAAELQALLNKAPAGTSAYIETECYRPIRGEQSPSVFSIRIEFTRRIFP